MAVKTLGMMFTIGGAVGGSFLKSMDVADRKVKRMGDSIRRLEDSAPHKLGRRFEELSGDLKTTGKELSRARKKLEELKATAKKSGTTTKRMASQIEVAERRVSELTRKFNRSRYALRGHTASLRNEGHSIRKVREEYHRLGQSIDATKAKRAKWEKAHAVGARARAGLDRVSPLAMGAALGGPMYFAAQREQKELRLKTVINSEDKAEAFASAKRAAQKEAEKGLVSYEDAIAIQYSLNSGGLKAGMAEKAMGVASRVAVTTSGEAEAVGEVITTSFNNLGKHMEGSAEEKFTRIGDVLAKAQNKFQIRDFNQLGESMNKGAAAMAGLNVNFEQGVTLLGLLNDAGRKGSEGGTAFSAMLRQLDKAEDEIGFSRVRDSRGQLDMIATLREISAATEGMGLDERESLLQEAFGDEGKAAVTPLLERLHLLDAAYKDVAESSRGYAKAKALDFEKSKMAQLNILRKGAEDLTNVLGAGLFPILNDMVPVATEFAAGLTAIAQANPALVKGIGYSIAGLLGLKAAAFALSPVMGIFGGLRKGFGLLRGKRGGKGPGGAVPVEVVNGGGPGGGGSGLFGGGRKGRRRGGLLKRMGGIFRRGGRMGRIGGLLGRAGGLAGKVFRPLGAVASLGSLAGGLASGSSSKIGTALGGMGGSAAGAWAGAALGSVVPVVGTAIGGFLGGTLGGYLGDWLGEKAGETVESAFADAGGEPSSAPAALSSPVSITQHFTIGSGDEATVRDAARQGAEDGAQAFGRALQDHAHNERRLAYGG